MPGLKQGSLTFMEPIKGFGMSQGHGKSSLYSYNEHKKMYPWYISGSLDFYNEGDENNGNVSAPSLIKDFKQTAGMSF